MKPFGFERRWTRAVYEAIFPRVEDSAIPVGMADLDIDAFLDDMHATWNSKGELGYRLAVIAVVVLSLFKLFRFRYTAIPVAKRTKAISELYASNVYLIRQLVILVKATGALYYGAHPSVRSVANVGKPGISPGLVELKRRTRSEHNTDEVAA